MKMAADFLASWCTWRQQLALCGERRLLVLAGSEHWAIDQAKQLVNTQAHNLTLWLGDAHDAHLTTPQNKFKTVLGKEYNVVVFNAFSGLHPDALGAVSGTLMAGGVLLLLCPPFADWPQYADPDLTRYVSQPEQAQGLHSRFITRFINQLTQDPNVTYWAEQAIAPTFTTSPFADSSIKRSPWQPSPDRHGCLNQQQRQALALMLNSARARTPMILTADRGRGKSSLLGLAAARLVTAGLQVLLTAPSPNAVAQVLAHCQQPLTFMAPDALLAENPHVDILLIDEAAAIPVVMLLTLAKRYCCIFSSTEHGYEGTGLGFQLKFQPQLLSMQPRTQKYHLHTPARWSAQDPLEPLLFKLLALNANVVTPPSHGPLEQRWVSRDELLSNETLLLQVFGLLILAHYQTRPSDLRQLLDAPGLSLAVTFRQHTPVAVALLTTEGALPDALALAIWRGLRRPRGHLLPQSLAFHGGFASACQFSYLRVMRIVVHPHCQQMGMGYQLLTWLQQQSKQLNIDFIGASFGATRELLSFWQASHFSAVRVGKSHDAVSGLQAVMMLWPSSAGAQQILPRWRQQFSANVSSHRLAQSTSQIRENDNHEAIVQMLTLLPPCDTAQEDAHIAYDFAFYHRDLGSDQSSLFRFVANRALSSPLTEIQQQQLNTLITPGNQPASAAKSLNLKGQKAAIAHTRQLMQVFFLVPSEI